MNIEEILKNKIPNLTKYKEIWKINFPILFTFYDGEQQYLAYTIESKARKQTFSCLIKKIESEEEIRLCLLQKNTLYKTLFSNEMNIFTYNKEFSDLKPISSSEFESLLPPHDMLFSSMLPNEVDISDFLITIK